MKALYLISTFTIFLVFCSCGIQAQPTETKPDQVELLKQFIGSWKQEGNDTILFLDQKEYGTGQDVYMKWVANGKTINDGRQLCGYNKGLDKIVIAAMARGTDLNIYVMWFISDNKYLGIPFSDISNPEYASVKIEGEIISPDRYIETVIINNKPVRTDIYIRVKE